MFDPAAQQARRLEALKSQSAKVRSVTSDSGL